MVSSLFCSFFIGVALCCISCSEITSRNVTATSADESVSNDKLGTTCTFSPLSLSEESVRSQLAYSKYNRLYPLSLFGNHKRPDTLKDFSLLQRFLANKYQLPALSGVLFSDELIRFCQPLLVETSCPHYGRSQLTPKDLLEHIGAKGWMPSPFLEQLILILYDYLSETDSEHKQYQIGDILFESHVLRILSIHRGLAYLRRIRNCFSLRSRNNGELFSDEPSKMLKEHNKNPDEWAKAFVTEHLSSPSVNKLWLFMLIIPKFTLPENTSMTAYSGLWKTIVYILSDEWLSGDSYIGPLTPLISQKLTPFLDEFLRNSGSPELVHEGDRYGEIDCLCLKLAAALLLGSYGLEARQLFPTNVHRDDAFYRFFLRHQGFFWEERA